MFASADEVLAYVKQHKIAMIDLKVVGIGGQWLHITIPAARLSRRHFEEGVGYDGSSGSGFATVENGDVAAVPDPASAFLDPFCAHPTLSLMCSTVRADTRAAFDADPRTIAARAEQHLRTSGIADKALMAPEFEFHILDGLEVRSEPYHTAVHIRSSEVDNPGHSPLIRPRHGYLRTPPADTLHDLRSEIALILEDLGVAVRYHHHEVGAPGQCEIEVGLAPLVLAADRAMLIKYVVKNVARRHGKLATFMPKPVFGEAGNGMHVHQKLDKSGVPVFFDAAGSYAQLSRTAMHYIGGLLAHGRALTALTNPSTNSFKRLVPGYEAPVNLFFSLANRSAAIRVPRYATAPEEKRIEYRPPDFTGNVYLTLAAMLMAGLDGIATEIDVQARHFGPFDVDIARQDTAFLERITPLPRSLYDATAALEADHAFLLAGEVFPQRLIDGWIATLRTRDNAEVARRPHPFEYEMYLDC